MTEPSNLQSATTFSQSSRKWLFAWLTVVLMLMIAIIVVRVQAIDHDHAKANLNTYIAGSLIWISSVVYFLVSRRWKLNLIIGLVPIATALAFLFLNRLERVDGELIPHFVSRWSAAPNLPAVTEPTVNDQTIPNDSAIFLPQVTDWLQYLGPGRNAKVSGSSIEPDWAGHAPNVLWQQSIGEGWSGFAVRGGVAVTMEQRDQQEWVSAYDLQTGSLLWRYVINARHSDPLGATGPRSTPSIYEDKVLACSAVSSLVCLQLTTGDELWTRDLNQLAEIDHSELLKDVNYGRSGSPLVHKSSVIVPLGGSARKASSLIAFDISSGKELWRAGQQQISFASPMLATLQGVEQILYPTKVDLLSCDPLTGQQLWTFGYDGSDESPNVAQPIPLDDHTIFLSKGYGVGARLVEVLHDPASGPTTWHLKQLKENRTVMRTKFTNPVYHNDHVYGLSDGILECIEARSLKRKWKRGRYHHGHVLLLPNCLLVTAEDGRVVLVELNSQEHRELGELAVLGDVTWNPPTLVGDCLLVRNANQVACLQVVQKESGSPQ